MGSAIDKLVGATSTATPKAPSLQAPVKKQSAIDRLINPPVAPKPATVVTITPKPVVTPPAAFLSLFPTATPTSATTAPSLLMNPKSQGMVFPIGAGLSTTGTGNGTAENAKATIIREEELGSQPVPQTPYNMSGADVASAARAIPRTVASLAMGNSGKTVEPVEMDPISRFLLGDESIKSLPTQAAELEQNLNQAGVKGKTGTFLAVTGVAANTVLNLLPFLAPLEEGGQGLADTLATNSEKITLSPEQLTEIANRNLADLPAEQQAVGGRFQKIAKAAADDGKSLTVDARTEPTSVTGKIAKAIGGENKAPFAKITEGGIPLQDTEQPISGVAPKPASEVDRLVSPETAAVTDKQFANNYLATNPEKTTADYTKIILNKYGSTNVVSADHAKEAIPGYNGTNSDEYQPAASKFATQYYDKLLQAQKGTANNTVLIFAGATGVGKTTSLKALGEQTSNYSIVYDTNSTTIKAASDKIDKALANGYKVRMMYVVRDPELAYKEGVIPRMGEERRVVTVDNHTQMHGEVYDTVPELQKKYGDKIQLDIVDNTAGPGQAKIVPVDKMPKIDHANNIKERLYGQLQEARQQNRITEQQFNKAAGTLGSAVRGQSEQERHSGRGTQSKSRQTGLENPKKAKPTELPTSKKGAPFVVPETVARGNDILERLKNGKPEKKAPTFERAGVKTKIQPDWAKSDDLTPGIIDQLKNAEPGKRMGLGYGSNTETIAWKSTFPDWIPQDLRLSSIIKPVAEHLANGTLPTSKKQIELYNYIADMIGAEDLAKQEVETEANKELGGELDDVNAINKLLDEAIADEAADKQKLESKQNDQRTISQSSEAKSQSKLPEKTQSESRSQKQVSGNFLASKGSKPIGTFEQMPDNVPETAMPAKGTAQFKLFERVEQFIKKYAERMGEGYLPRNARGVFYKDSKNIFIDGLNNVSVAAHETTHYIDQKYEIIKQVKEIKDKTAEIKKQLTNLYVSYYPGGRVTHKLDLRLREGYATLVQKYAELPQTIQAEHPYLVKEFLKPGGRYYHPVVGEMVEDLRTLITDYQGLSSLDKIGSMVGNGDFNVDKKSFLSLWETIRTVIADDIYPAEVLDTRAGLANSKKSVSLMLRGARNYTASVFQHNLDGKNGLWIFDKSGEIVKVNKNNIGNLIQDLAKKKMIDEFAYYLVARDGHFEYQRLDEMKKALDEITDQESKEYQTKLAEYEDQKKRVENNPFTRQELTNAYEENKNRFSEEEQMFDEMTKQGELQALHNAQILSPESFTEFSSRKGYASRKRIALYNEILGEELGGASSQLKVGKTKISSLIRRKGSQRAIQNPLYSLIRDHGEIMTKTAKQHVYNRALDSWAPNFPDLFQTQKYSMGVEKDNHYIIARKDYKKVPILVDNLVKNVLDNILAPSNLNFFESALRVAAQVKTIGTTGLYAPFAAVNFLRDNITAPIFSANKYIPVYDAIKELVKILDPTNPEHLFAKEWFTLGGEKYTLVSMSSDPSEILKKVAREKTGILAALNDFREGTIEKIVPTKFGKTIATEATENFGLGALSMPAKYSEIMTRLTEYVKARQAGKDVWTAMEDSQRVSGPFSHIGAWQKLGKPKSHGATWIKSIPFANASLEVFDQLLRTMATKGGRKRFSFVAVAIMAAMISTLYYTKKKSTEEQRQMIKDMDPNMLARYIFVPKPSGEDFYRIPVPTEAAMPAVLMNMYLLDKWFGADYSLGEYADAGTAFLPDQLNPESYTNGPKAIAAFMPQVVSMFFQSITKTKVFPSILPVESDRMKTLPSEDRYNEGTSAVAKWIGNTGLAKKFDLSPLMTDFLLTGWLGRASGLATGQQQSYDPSSQFLQPYYWESGRTMNNYWNWQEYIDQQTTALKQLHQPPDIKALENRGLATQIGKLMTIYGKIFKTGDIQHANELRMQILNMASGLPKFSK